MLKTEKDTLRETWLAEGLCPICGQDHRRGIGGTMMGMILGLVEWNGVRYNALDAYHRLTRDLWDPGIDSIHQWRGNFLEPHIAEWYEEETGRPVFEFEEFPGDRPEGWNEGWAEHPDFPAFVVHPDRLVGEEGRKVLEIKAPSRAVFQRVYEEGLRKSEVVQIATYESVLRLTEGAFAFGSTEHEAGPLLQFDLPLDEGLGEFLLEVGQRFYDEHVEPRIPPDPDEWLLLPDPFYEILDRPGEVEVVDPAEVPEFADLAREGLEAKDLKKKAEENYDATKTKLQALIERDYEGDKILLPGVARLTIVRSEGRSSFSKKALEGHRPIDRDKLFRMIREEGVDRLRDATTPEALDEVLDDLALDLGAFDRQGNPFSYILVNPNKG